MSVKITWRRYALSRAPSSYYYYCCCCYSPGGDHFKDSDTSDKQERSLRGSDGSNVDAGTPGQHTTARDRGATFNHSTSGAARSNESEPLNKNSTTSNSCVDGASTSSKSSVVEAASRKELSGENEKEEELSPRSAVKTAWNDWKSGGKHRRRRRRNVSASTQTLPTVDELDGTAGATEWTEDSGQAENEQTWGDLSKDDLTSLVVDILQEIFAPVFARDGQPTRRSHSPAAVQRYSHLHRQSYYPYQHPCPHQHHHLHRQQQQRRQEQQQYQRRVSTQSNFNQHNRRPVHSSPSACASCNMHKHDFRDAVVFTGSRGTLADVHHGTCARCSRVARGRPVVVAGAGRSSSAPAVPKPSYTSSTAGQRLPAAEPEDRREESDSPSTPASEGRRPLTDEALRQRIERVVVEMESLTEDREESKVSAALRQAIIDSAAFPTLFTD